jgi:dihydrodipicolinate synthase/N-acetylneuraminate lyase
MLPESIADKLHQGQAIPAHPLALTDEGGFDEKRQRALTRYYCDAGAGGVAVAVHTTQFEIREPRHGLFEPVLELASETVDADAKRSMIKVGGICGETEQAVGEAETLNRFDYHIGLVSLAAMREASVDDMIDHCRAIAEVIPVMGFYLQPAVGGPPLSAAFWRRFVEIENVVAIKIAPFNRYQTLDVLRAVAESGRAGEIALYTGNDDTIVSDLLTSFRFNVDGKRVRLRIVGGLLGHWACWTRQAVHLLEECHRAVKADRETTFDLLTRAAEVTDSNGAFFDVANGFKGCIAGIHEVLCRQGLMTTRRCLDPNEDLSPGQLVEIDRVYSAYPHLNDDAFVEKHLDEWLA